MARRQSPLACSVLHHRNDLFCQQFASAVHSREELVFVLP
jgi:hypothetical protein